MSDAVERVARVICFADGSVEGPDGKLILEKACDCESAESCYEVGSSLRPEMRGQALAAIEEYKAYLAKQGIPVEQLLSGEMVAQKPEMMLTVPEMVHQIEHLQACISDTQRGNLEQFKGHMRTMQEINEAALDYHLSSDIVTPERAQERTGATHSQRWTQPDLAGNRVKWTLTGPAQPPEPKHKAIPPFAGVHPWDK